MSLQVEGVMPDGFHYEREQNISHGVYGGLELFILPMDAENQYQVQLYTDADKIENREGFFEYLETLHPLCIAPDTTVQIWFISMSRSGSKRIRRT